MMVELEDKVLRLSCPQLWCRTKHGVSTPRLLCCHSAGDMEPDPTSLAKQEGSLPRAGWGAEFVSE